VREETIVQQIDAFAKANLKGLKEGFLDAHLGVTEGQYNADHDITVDESID